MNPRSFALGLCVVALVFSACTERETVTSPAPVGSSAAPVTPSAKPPAKPPSADPAPTTAKESADTWLVVNKGGVELGLIELRAGKPPKLSTQIDNEDSVALKAKLEAIGGPQGIGLDMHLPPPSGEGRGPYGTQVIQYADRLYRHALTNALEPTFDVKEVPGITEAVPATFGQLHISRSDKKVGTLDFGSKPPKLTLHTEESDGGFLRIHWEHIETLDPIKVRYHVPKDSVETLVDVQSKPGDPSYAQAVALYLIVMNQYQPRYAYKLDFIP